MSFGIGHSATKVQAAMFAMDEVTCSPILSTGRRCDRRPRAAAYGPGAFRVVRVVRVIQLFRAVRGANVPGGGGSLGEPAEKVGREHAGHAVSATSAAALGNQRAEAQ